MANGLFKLGVAEIWRNNIDVETADLRALLVNTSGAGTPHAFNLTTDQYLDDITSGAVVSTSPTLTTVTISDVGVVDCDDFTFPSVTGDVCEEIIIYNHTGTPSTSALIARIDTNAAAGAISLTPDGNNVTVTVNASGLIAL